MFCHLSNWIYFSFKIPKGWLNTCKEYRELSKMYFRDSSYTFSKLLKSLYQDKQELFKGYYILHVPHLRDLHYYLKMFRIKKCKKLHHNISFISIYIYLQSKMLYLWQEYYLFFKNSYILLWTSYTTRERGLFNLVELNWKWGHHGNCLLCNFGNRC